MMEEPGLEINMDIHSACSLGYDSYVKQLLDSNTVDINMKNSHGWTPLMYACWGGHEGVVTRLLDIGASTLELNHENQSSLFLATKSGNIRIVQLTFQKSVLNEADKSGKTALYNAVEFRYYNIAHYLLMKGADVNPSNINITPLMVAAMNGELPLVELLLKFGAQRQLQTKEGLTAHHLAAKHGHHDVIELLETSHTDFPDLKSFLKSLYLEKYFPVFEKHEIDLEGFLNLNENDLKSIGIKLLGPRRKMSLAIAAFTKRKTPCMLKE